MAAVRASVVNPDSLVRDAVKQAPLVRNCHSLLLQLSEYPLRGAGPVSYAA
jgi:hypothetical protein